MSAVKKRLARLVAGTMFMNYGRDIVSGWVEEYAYRSGRGDLRVLDLGAGRGDDLANIAEALSGRVCVELFGVECRKENVQAARARGIAVFEVDVEREAVPLAGRSIDVVVANQIVEHTKEIFWIFSEISRILRSGGIAIIGVPNLAAWHNRLFLLFGAQPTCIEILGPHVRGFTIGAFREFVERGGYFECTAVKGANFYPFPPSVSGFLSRAFPSLSVSLFFLLRRTDREGRYIEVLDSLDLETPYFRGAAG